MSKQVTYLTTNAEHEKENILRSGLAFCRDYSFGWFDVPRRYLAEFKAKFPNIITIEHSACSSDVTRESIMAFNSRLLIANKM